MADKKISALTTKTPPVDNDSVPIYDSVAGATKQTLWSAIKSTLKTYFDTLYQAILVSGTNIKTIGGASILGSGNIAVGGTGFCDTQVYSGAGSTSYADLDLSSVVGATTRIVMLSVRSNTYGSIFFKTPADSYANPPQSGVGYISCGNSGDNFQYVLVKTSPAGVIQWLRASPASTTTLKVVAFW